MVRIKDAIIDLNNSELVSDKDKEICTTNGELIILLEELERMRNIIPFIITRRNELCELYKKTNDKQEQFAIRVRWNELGRLLDTIGYVEEIDDDLTNIINDLPN